MVQIGAYGLGGISRRVIQGVLFSRNANLYAVCSSSIEKADAYKEEYGAKKLTITMRICCRIQI